MASKQTGKRSGRRPGLLEHVAKPETLALSGDQEAAWIEVIHKMEQVYADLIHYEVELEEKNVALEEAQQFIASVLSSMSDALIVCDQQGRIEQVNHALEQLTGRSASDLQGESFEDLFAETSRPLVASFPAKIREGAVHDCELGLKGRGEEVIPLATNCTSRYDHHGRLVGMVLIGRPVGELRRAYEALNTAHTELREAQFKLIQSEKMASLGRLVAGVAHELNNPISFVYGNVHTLKRYGERLKRYLAAVHGGADEHQLQQLREELRIDRLLQDLDSLIEGTLEGAERTRDIVQDLRRLSANDRSKNEVFDFGEVIKRAVAWATKGAKRPLTVHYDFSQPLMVKGNVGQLHQVVVNLVQNALDATQGCSDPSLDITGSVEQGRVMVSFSDNGPGISKDDLLKIFDPFFTTKPVGQGTGLGLSISYGIVEDHGGELDVANGEEGGAVFRVGLPYYGEKFEVES